MATDVNDFFEQHPEFKTAKFKSEYFSELKQKLSPPIYIDDEELYFLYGDAGQVNEDELYHQALLIGSQEENTDSVYKNIYEELKPELKEIIKNELNSSDKEDKTM